MNLEPFIEIIRYQNLYTIPSKMIKEEIKYLQTNNKIHYTTNYWEYILNPNDERLNKIFGKFMLFYTGDLEENTKELLIKMINLNLSPIIKYPYKQKKSSIICIYSTANKEEITKIAEFMIENNMIRKTKNEIYMNAAYGKQRLKEEEFKEVPFELKYKLKLSSFINLSTGKRL